MQFLCTVCSRPDHRLRYRKPEASRLNCYAHICRQPRIHVSGIRKWYTLSWSHFPFPAQWMHSLVLVHRSSIKHKRMYSGYWIAIWKVHILFHSYLHLEHKGIFKSQKKSKGNTRGFVGEDGANHSTMWHRKMSSCGVRKRKKKSQSILMKNRPAQSNKHICREKTIHVDF